MSATPSEIAIDKFDALTITNDDADQDSDYEDDTDGNYIPFRIDGKGVEGSLYNDIPRYMYRVYTSKTSTDADSNWIMSPDAARNTDDYEVNVYARKDKAAAAKMINSHFRQTFTTTSASDARRDNLISWTSSLLSALLYIFHRHTSPAEGSPPLTDIHLCVLDTSSYNEGAFIRAESLIAAFREHSPELQKLERQRADNPCHQGEYLNQGRLNIEGACEIASADKLVGCGLFTLLPELEALAERWTRKGEPTAPTWDAALERLREAWDPDSPSFVDEYEFTAEENEAAMDIGALFGVYLQVPVAAAVTALRPRRDGGVGFAFRELRIQEEIKDRGYQFGPSKCNSPDSSDEMPEVKQFSTMMTSVFADFFVTEAKEKILDARILMEEAAVAMDELHREAKHLRKGDVESLFVGRYGEMMTEVGWHNDAIWSRLQDLARIRN